MRGRRIRLRLLDQDADPAPRESSPQAYVPVDISGDYLRESAARVDERVSRACRSIRSRPTSPGRSPCRGEVGGLPKLGFFPGSTIGNFVPRSATDLLRHFRDILGTGARLLIGMDRVKAGRAADRRL